MVTGDGNRLGRFLRTRRAQLRPEAVGIRSDRRRVISGLRRDEVALLAGLSTPYLARLEQGRDRNPSRRVVDELGRALQLDEFETEHLRVLAGHPSCAPTRNAGAVRPGLRALMTAWTDHAAFVQDRCGTVVAANELAIALCPMFRPGTNVLRWLFLDADARVHCPDWDEAASSAVGAVLVTSAAGPVGPEFEDLIGELRAQSRHFQRLWSSYRICDTTIGLSTFRTPGAGVLTLDRERLAVDDERHLYLLFAEPGSPDHAALMRLRPPSVRPSREASTGRASSL